MNLLETKSGRKALFMALYLSEGAPIGFIWWALPTRLKLAGVELDRITGLLALLALPWALKFLWAPLIDVLRSRRFGYKAWILSAQLLMGASLLPLFWLDLGQQFELIYLLFTVHAFTAATQDVAIDSLTIAVTPKEEHGSINGWMQAGMLLGRTLFGPGVLKLGEALGNTAIFAALLGAIWFSAFVLILFTREPLRVRPAKAWSAFEQFRTALLTALKQRNTWMGVGLAVLGGAGFEAVGAVAGPFLLEHLTHLPKAEASGYVGTFYLYAVGLMLAGALLGGFGADRFGHRRTVALVLVLMTLLILILSGAEASGKAGTFTLAGLLAAIYFAIGSYTASSYGLFMDLTDRRLGATQFSAFMGMTNVCESWSVKAIGKLQPVYGFGGGFAILAAISLVALVFLACMRPTRTANTGPLE